MSNFPLYPDADTIVESIIPGIKDAVARAYIAGFRNGVESGRSSMRDAILKAAQEPVEIPALPTKPVSGSPTADDLVKVITRHQVHRAPRGTVRKTIELALATNPGGLTEKELAAEMERIDPNVSGRSAGGELRRLKGRLYRQEGGKWFLTKNGLRYAERPFVTETEESINSAVPQLQTTHEDRMNRPP